MMTRKPPHPPAQTFFPDHPTIRKLTDAVQQCTACDLWEKATQAVFGEGPPKASVMFVGEQPGDQEDLQGRPFVGPTGQMLDDALAEVGIPREAVYVTNAVKHFRWEPRGKKRLHKPPSLLQMKACFPWLQEELRLVKPKAVVCLGATAAKSLLGPAFRITTQRGEVYETPHAPWVLATYHPAAIVRMPDPDKRREARALFHEDLEKVARRLRDLSGR